VEILPEENAVVIAGSVPGPDGGLVVVRHTSRVRHLEQPVNG
jgi:ribosomal protein L3